MHTTHSSLSIITDIDTFVSNIFECNTLYTSIITINIKMFYVDIFDIDTFVTSTWNSLLLLLLMLSFLRSSTDLVPQSGVYFFIHLQHHYYYY